MYFLYGLAYFAYAFTQASAQVKLGHTFREYENDRQPLSDFIGFFALAPIITAFWLTAFTLVGPYKLLDKYVHMPRFE